MTRKQFFGSLFGLAIGKKAIDKKEDSVIPLITFHGNVTMKNLDFTVNHNGLLIEGNNNKPRFNTENEIRECLSVVKDNGMTKKDEGGYLIPNNIKLPKQNEILMREHIIEFDPPLEVEPGGELEILGYMPEG